MVNKIKLLALSLMLTQIPYASSATDQQNVTIALGSTTFIALSDPAITIPALVNPESPDAFTGTAETEVSFEYVPGAGPGPFYFKVVAEATPQLGWAVGDQLSAQLVNLDNFPLLIQGTTSLGPKKLFDSFLSELRNNTFYQENMTYEFSSKVATGDADRTCYVTLTISAN